MDTIISLAIPEVKLITPRMFNDDRGFFFESYNQQVFNSLLHSDIHFVQDNHSKTKKNVIRGLHYQLPPFAQGKLVRVLSGSIFDVAVDIRKSSLTFGKWVGEVLSAKNRKMLWIPEGFAHGFISLEESSEVLYKATNFYNPNFERTIIWNDVDLNINWMNKKNVILSSKDTLGKSLRIADLFI